MDQSAQPGESALDPQAVRGWLDPYCPPLELECHSRIGSTNDRGKELARQGAPAWKVVVADRQFAGRGRRGKHWDSPSGKNIYLTVTLPPPAGADELGHLPLLAGVASTEALDTLGLTVRLKWPNDLLTPEGKKVGGILAETEPRSGQVVLGIGLNVRGGTSGGDGPEPLARGELQGQAGERLDRNRMIGILVTHLYGVWVRYRNEGFPFIREQWEGRAWKMGETVRLEGEGITCTGTLSGLDRWGRLLLTTPEGPRAFASGFLSLRW